jgi:hypothetical protein
MLAMYPTLAKIDLNGPASYTHKSPTFTRFTTEPPIVEYFRFFFAYDHFMFPGPDSTKRVVVCCKGCRENIPAPVESMPAQPIAARCPLCGDYRRYLPVEVFLGRLSHSMLRKPVRTADGRASR